LKQSWKQRDFRFALNPFRLLYMIHIDLLPRLVLTKNLLPEIYLIVIALVFFNCKSVDRLGSDTQIYKNGEPEGRNEQEFFGEQTNIPENKLADESLIAEKVETILVPAPIRVETESDIPESLPIDELLDSGIDSASPVAQKTVRNYWANPIKKPGGHCLTACKTRFEIAYEDVHGHSFYKDLPDKMATKFYSPQETFNHLYASTSGKHKGWRTLPKKYRGKGGPGAIAFAGMGALVNWFDIWNGGLKPGAVMQVWSKRKGYREVIKGIDEDGFEGFGHSFIFLGYERDEKGEITGLRIADQGYQSHRPLVPRDYDVWWGVNLSI